MTYSTPTVSTVASGEVHLSTKGLAEGTRIWCSSIGCHNVEVLVQLLLALLVGALALALVALVSNVRAASDECDEERRRTLAERDAFVEFARRVADTDAVTMQEGTAQMGVARAVQTTSGQGLQRVQDHYRDTVMAVDHYDEAYDESLPEHMAAEFGENLAGTVINGMALSPQVKQALIQRSEEAKRGRESLLRSFEREATQLDDAAERISAVDARVDDIDDRPLSEKSYARLRDDLSTIEELEAQTEQLLTDRQSTLHGDVTTVDDGESISLQEYLYGPLDVTYPVLADGTALLDRLRTARSRVTKTLVGRV